MGWTLLTAAGAALLVLGLALATIGLVGLLRKPDVFHQLHAAGLVTGPATILVLLAAIATRNLEIVTSAVLVILFLLVTAPLSGHAIAQAAYRRANANADADGKRDGAATAAPPSRRDTPRAAPPPPPRPR